MTEQAACEVLYRGQLDSLLVENLLRREETVASKKHFHNHLEIYYLVSGERYLYIRGRTYHITAGDLAVISGNIVHQASTISSPVHERIILEVYPPMLRQMLELEQAFTDLYGVLHLKGLQQQEVQALIYSLMDEMKQQSYGYQWVVRCKLIQLLIFILRELGTQHSPVPVTSGPREQKMREIAQYISRHPDQKITLDWLSEQFYVSKYHLCRTFKDITGFTLSEYINISRITKAKELLLTTNSSVTDIASEVGYESSTHFGKVFKQYLGQSPLSYRNQYSIKMPPKK